MMHMDTPRQACNMGRMTNDQLETQHFEQFVDWYRDYTRLMSFYLLKYEYICFSFLFSHQLTLRLPLYVIYSQVDGLDD
jgi:hypothetical protein